MRIGLVRQGQELKTQASAQQRADQISAFQKELTELEQDGVLSLTEQQSQHVQQYHHKLLHDFRSQFDVDTTIQSRQLSVGMKIASMVGALAMAMSVFFLFYQFWGYLNTPTQVCILIAAPVSMLLLTLHLVKSEKYVYFAKIAALVALAGFVLNLSLLGRMFNITPSPNALLLWSTFGILLAYACNARLVLFFGICFLATFLAMRVGTWFDSYWIQFADHPENFFVPGVLIFLIPLIVKHQRFNGFAPVYRVMAMIMLFLPILVLSIWGEISYLTGDKDWIEGSYQITGFVLAGLAIWLGIRQQWGDVSTTGNVFLVLFLYTKFFDWWWEWMPKYIFFFLMGLIAILLLMVFKRVRHSGLLQAKTGQQGARA